MKKNNSGAKIKIVPYLNQELIPKLSSDSIPRSCFDRDLTYKNKPNDKNASKLTKTNFSLKSDGNSVYNQSQSNLSIRTGSFQNILNEDMNRK